MRMVEGNQTIRDAVDISSTWSERNLVPSARKVRRVPVQAGLVLSIDASIFVCTLSRMGLKYWQME